MDTNTRIGALAGVVTGFSKYLMMINADFLMRMAESGLAALLTGGLGTLGAYLMSIIIKRIKTNNGKSERTPEQQNTNVVPKNYLDL